MSPRQIIGGVRHLALGKSVTFEPKNSEALSIFFDKNGDDYHEIWVVLTKKKCANPQPVSFEEAVTEAKKRGLVDSRTKSIDECKYSIRFTKRKVKSI